MSNTPHTERPTPALSEALFTLLETLPGALFVVDDAAIIVYANASAQTLTAATREELCGKPLWRGAAHLVSATLYQAVQKAIQTRTPGEVEYRSSVTGTWLHVQLSPTLGGLMMQFHQGGTVARHDEAIYTLIDAIPQFVWITRPDGSSTYNNQRLIDYLAMDRQQVEGHGWLEGVHPDDRQRIWQAWQTSVQTGTPFEVELRLRDGASGAYRWFLARGVPQRDAEGTILHWFGTCTDIEEQKRTEQQLKESQENWRVLAETVPQLVWTTRPDGRFEYGNQRCRDYTGISLERMQGDLWAHLQFIHPDDRKSSRAHWQHALDTGEIYEREERLRNAQTGEYRWFLIRAMPVRDETGRIIKWVGSSTDIEEQKRIEEALRQSQKRIHALVNSNIIGIVTIDIDAGEVVLEANDTWLRMSGYSREDVDSKTLTVARITPQEQMSFFEHVGRELTAHGQFTPVDVEMVCKDGSRLPMLIGGVLFQDHPRRVISFALDNSARKELERRKDDFINMASHELRNPLAILTLQSTLLHRKLVRQGVLDQISALSSMEGQVKIMTRLVEELLDVSRIQEGRLNYRQEPVDLDVLLRDVADSMQQSHPSHRILVRGSVGGSLMGDRDRLEQVFANLLSNAIKYSPDAGTVEMDLSIYDDVVTIRVQDHGLGIPRELRGKIFERFYRAPGLRQRVISGLGMGLYIVAEIVKHYGGTITVDSEVGKGSTFTVTLPKGGMPDHDKHTTNS